MQAESELVDEDHPPGTSPIFDAGRFLYTTTVLALLLPGEKNGFFGGLGWWCAVFFCALSTST